MVDLLLGGSPCQGFSFAGKQLNFFDHRSKLFFDYVKALETLKPRYFLFENVKMKKEYEDVITEYLGVNPIEINSALVSAQNRRRLYWTNIPNVKQPENKHIYLHDILESGYTDRMKSYCIVATYFNKGANLEQYLKRKRHQIVFETPVRLGEFNSGEQSDRVYVIRKLTPIECERLQTLPDNYTEGVSKTQRYKVLGNSWTVDVIAHILSFIPEKHLHTVVSLFDGISCGQVALGRAGKTYSQYYASEIDKYAIQITQKHFPNTIQLGDVTKIDWNTFLEQQCDYIETEGDF